jgi:hypothetical protein
VKDSVAGVQVRIELVSMVCRRVFARASSFVPTESLPSLPGVGQLGRVCRLFYFIFDTEPARFRVNRGGTRSRQRTGVRRGQARGEVSPLCDDYGWRIGGERAG